MLYKHSMYIDGHYLALSLGLVALVSIPSNGSAQGMPSAVLPTISTQTTGPPHDAVAADILASSPSIRISNGLINVKLYPPDPAQGFYRGTRFDWSGVIGSLVFKGHDFYTPWFTKASPTVVDFTYDGADIIAGPSSAITGPVEEFSTNGSALGFDEAQTGETFIKIGVGVLKKLDSAVYSAYRKYPFVDHGKWTVRSNRSTAEFTHILRDPASGYGYRYVKSVKLVNDQPILLIKHRLINIGSKRISTLVYDHNFLNIDHHGLHRGLAVTLPFKPEIDKPLPTGLAALNGKQITYLKTLVGIETVATPISGFGSTPADYDIRITDRDSNAGLRITADQPLARLSLWSIRSVMAIEPFVNITIEPGQEFSWTYTYQYAANNSDTDSHH